MVTAGEFREAVRDATCKKKNGNKVDTVSNLLLNTITRIAIVGPLCLNGEQRLARTCRNGSSPPPGSLVFAAGKEVFDSALK